MEIPAPGISVTEIPAPREIPRNIVYENKEISENFFRNESPIPDVLWANSAPKIPSECRGGGGDGELRFTRCIFDWSCILNSSELQSFPVCTCFG